jgi:ketopantoate reductase
MAKKPVIVVGMGEMGSVFARAFLKQGHPVYPVNRHTDINKLARTVPKPRTVLVAVGENDLQAVLKTLPKTWRTRLTLLQNELLPADYRDLSKVTVISVWFEKKKGRDSKVIIASPAHGPRARLLQKALSTLDIPVRIVEKQHKILFELVLKNLYILTSNVAGLRVGGTVGELWRDHPDFARKVANDVIRLQEALTGSRFDNDELVDAMVTAFNGDPGHNCMGRSAPARLERALSHADRLGIELPTLREIADERYAHDNTATPA